jgi:hypothetical protein
VSTVLNTHNIVRFDTNILIEIKTHPRTSVLSVVFVFDVALNLVQPIQK